MEPPAETTATTATTATGPEDAAPRPPAGWEELGVAPFDHTVLLRALRDPDAGVPGWAATLAVPEWRVRRAARHLRQLGLLRPAAHDRNRLEPADPASALRAAVRSRQHEVDRLAAAAGGLAEQLAAEFERGRSRRRPDGILEIVEGRAAVAHRLDELLESAETELSGIDAPPYLGEPETFAAAEKRALAEGVRFRALYAAPILDDPERFAALLTAVAAGEEARILAAAAPMKLLLVDRRTALLPLTLDEPADSHRALVVRGSALLDALQALFEALWSQGAPVRGPGRLPDRERLDGAGLTGEERELVELMGAGMTDESIARHLGISARTLRRRVRDLQSRLGSTGRFQAGVRAAQRGWL